MLPPSSERDNQVWKEHGVLPKHLNVSKTIRFKSQKVATVTFSLLSCRPVDVHRRFIKMVLFQILALKNKSRNQISLGYCLLHSLFDHEMEVESSSETSVNFYRPLLPHIL